MQINSTASKEIICAQQNPQESKDEWQTEEPSRGKGLVNQSKSSNQSAGKNVGRRLEKERNVTDA